MDFGLETFLLVISILIFLAMLIERHGNG